MALKSVYNDNWILFLRISKSNFFARRYGNVSFLIKLAHFERFDQWFFVYVVLNFFRNLYLGKHLSVAPWEISWIGRKVPTAETVKAAVIWLLSSTPFMRIVVDPFKQNVYLPSDTYNNGVWLRLRTKSRRSSYFLSRISCL